jgi:antibiotic biosynthesis monooxygenase (ABM) superfamily enzyme
MFWRAVVGCLGLYPTRVLVLSVLAPLTRDLSFPVMVLVPVTQLISFPLAGGWLPV